MKRRTRVGRIQSCYAREIRLLATSNLTLDQLYEVSPSIGSRIAEMCDVVEFAEPDYRLVLAEQRQRRRGGPSGVLLN